MLQARRTLKWTGIVVLALLALLLVAVLVLQASGDALRGPLARMLSSAAGRPVRLDGRLELHLIAQHPRVIIRDLRLANPQWAGPGDTARIGELQLQFRYLPLLAGRLVLPYVGIENTDFNLIRDARDRANWRLGNPDRPRAKPGAAPRLPMVGSLHVGAGHLRVADAIRKLRFDGTVAAAQAPQGGALSLKVKGQGNINGADFEMQAGGDPLIRAEQGKPYTVGADVRAGRTHVVTRVTLTHPFDLNVLEVDMQASGDDFADLYYLSGLALPNSKPYSVAGHLARRGNRLELTRMQGRLGNSDIGGSATIDLSDVRPRLQAELATRRFDIADLGPTLGAQQAVNPSSLSRGEAPGKPPAHRHVSARRAAAGATLLPDAPLDLQRVRGMDATAHWHADAVNAPKMTVRAIDMRLKLEHGVLSLEPLSADLPQGRVVTRLRIDASHDLPDVRLDTRLLNVKLEQFKTKGGGTPPLEGVLLGRAMIHGEGRSVHQVAATASGTLSLVVPHGEIRQAFAELTGINVAKGLGLLLGKGQQQAELRCGVADFRASGGVFAAESIVFDTSTVLITGKGEVDLGSEVLDLSLQGQPKKLRLVRLRSPIEIGGTLRKPRASLAAGKVAAQAGAAAALGALLTPVAAVLAFVDPGLAKDANCGALLAQAHHEGAPLPGGARAATRSAQAPESDGRRLR